MAYSSGDNVEVKVPGHGPRSFSVDGMGEAGTAYDISYGIFEREGEVAYVDADGKLARAPRPSCRSMWNISFICSSSNLLRLARLIASASSCLTVSS